MNPLEDIVVALQPITPILPFPLPNSVRLLDVTSAAGATGNPPFSNLNPYSNAGITTVNEPQNFGWEYVWHCHILGHEENDMMRPIIFQVAPPAPSSLAAVNDINTAGQVDLVFTDNSANETGFIVQRDLDPSFPNPVSIAVGPSATLNAAKEGVDWGSPQTAIDNPGSGTYFYRVQAVDDGWAGGMSQTYNAGILGKLYSGWSNVAFVGTAANATVSPSPLLFGSVLVNTTSAAQMVTVSNAAGAGTLAISGVSFTGANPGDFVITANTCTSSLAGGSSCTISVALRPTATGSRAAALTITSSNPKALSVSLSGAGVAPVISPNNNAFQFGNITVGTTTTNPQVLTITNNGNAPLVINGATISGGNASDFAISYNGCPIGGAGVPAGQNCMISMTFTPKATGNRSSVLIINSSDPVTPVLNISLSGFGTQSIAAISPASLTFPVQLVNTTSATQTVTLSNTGNVAYTINSVSLTGTNSADFVLNYSCTIGGNGMAGGGNCSISVTFRPTAAGPRTAVVNIVTTANVNPTLAINVTGTGTQVNLSTTSLTFAPQVVGTQSASQQVTLTNTGPTALHINSITLAGANPTDFTQTSNCPVGGNLGSGGSCRVTLRFGPTAVGVRSGTLAISTNDAGTPVASVTLTGTGIQAAVSLTPTSYDFGAVTAKSTSAPFAFTLKNSGTAAVTINNISIGGANGNRFNQTNNCGNTLAVGASCTVNVTFTPNKAGTAYSGTLQINDNAPNSPQTATLTGTGQ